MHIVINERYRKMNVLKIVGWMGMVLMGCVGAFGQTCRMEGTIGGRYPIVLELEEIDRHMYVGIYAYQSTLKRDGDSQEAWLRMYPEEDNERGGWSVFDYKGEYVENWYDVRIYDGQYLVARMTNTKGKSYDVEASVPGADKVYEPLKFFFKEHLGEDPSHFDAFSDYRVRERLSRLLGTNFEVLRSFNISDYGYDSDLSMFRGEGYKPHQGLDTYAAWGYNVRRNAFYVHIFYEGQDYWWSETGEIPFEFRLRLAP